MSQNVQELLTSYFSQQAEMGIPSDLVVPRDTSEEKQSLTSITMAPYQQEAPSTSVEMQSSTPTEVTSVPMEETPEISSIQEEPPAQTSSAPDNGQSLTATNGDRESLRSVLADLFRRSQTCTGCGLSQTRTKVVFGSGDVMADILIVGEAPGFEDDEKGRPFEGPAGDLLTKMLHFINIDRTEGVFITNIVKCRPPGNRTPSVEECTTCIPILKRQIAIIQPKIVLALGKTAATTLLQDNRSITALRQQEYSYHGTPLFVTYHPSALIRDSSLKRAAMEDLQLFQKRYLEIHNG